MALRADLLVCNYRDNPSVALIQTHSEDCSDQQTPARSLKLLQGSLLVYDDVFYSFYRHLYAFILRAQQQL
jgi:hypothetical protein